MHSNRPLPKTMALAIAAGVALNGAVAPSTYVPVPAAHAQTQTHAVQRIYLYDTDTDSETSDPVKPGDTHLRTRIVFKPQGFVSGDTISIRVPQTELGNVSSGTLIETPLHLAGLNSEQNDVPITIGDTTVGSATIRGNAVEIEFNDNITLAGTDSEIVLNAGAYSYYKLVPEEQKPATGDFYTVDDYTLEVKETRAGVTSSYDLNTSIDVRMGYIRVHDKTEEYFVYTSAKYNTSTAQGRVDVKYLEAHAPRTDSVRSEVRFIIEPLVKKGGDLDFLPWSFYSLDELESRIAVYSRTKGQGDQYVEHPDQTLEYTVTKDDNSIEFVVKDVPAGVSPTVRINDPGYADYTQDGIYSTWFGTDYGNFSEVGASIRQSGGSSGSGMVLTREASVEVTAEGYDQDPAPTAGRLTTYLVKITNEGTASLSVPTVIFPDGTEREYEDVTIPAGESYTIKVPYTAAESDRSLEWGVKYAFLDKVTDTVRISLDKTTDSDGDGVPDFFEIQDGTDPKNPDDFKDSDGDGVPDFVEDKDGTDKNNADDFKDSDGDGVPDYVEDRDGTDKNNADDFKDSDGDGVPDYVEGREGTDKDNADDFKDSDGDGVPDYVEDRDGTDKNNADDFKDSDGDGVPDYVEDRHGDADTDGDGVPDYVEDRDGTDKNNADDFKDSDGDGVPDYVEDRDGTDKNNADDFKDSDGDGVPDYVEDRDGTNKTDKDSFKDSDGDGVPDYVEDRDGTNKTDKDSFKDTDGDGVPDYVEDRDGTDKNNDKDFKDTDGDGVPDYVEDREGTNKNDKNDFKDTDGDGVPDYVEDREGTDKTDKDSFKDTDGDGVPDYVEDRDGTDKNDKGSFKDTDGDGVPDYVEDREGTDKTDKYDFKDTDGDGVPDYVEIGQGTDPKTAGDALDSDGDGYSDHEEWLAGTNPKDPNDFPGSSVDSDGDGFSDGLEKLMGTDPLNPQDFPGADVDSDRDGVPDVIEERFGTNPHDPNNYPAWNGNPGSKEDNPNKHRSYLNRCIMTSPALAASTGIPLIALTVAAMPQTRMVFEQIAANMESRVMPLLPPHVRQMIEDNRPTIDATGGAVGVATSVGFLLAALFGGVGAINDCVAQADKSIGEEYTPPADWQESLDGASSHAADGSSVREDS